MNNTNRAANRITLLVIGLVFLAVGAAAVLAMSWPAAGSVWTDALTRASDWLVEQEEATTLEGGSTSWLYIAVVAALVIAAIVLVLCLTRLGGRRSHTVIRSTGAENGLGRVTVTDGFASEALQRAFDTRDDVLFANVSAADVKKEPVMHVSVSPRQNTSPLAVATDVDTLVTNLDALTGRQLPTLISIHSGLRTRLAADQRRIS